MLVSIIVPVYNVKDYLVKCLDSIEQQTFTDYEVIIIDDGSTDGSGKIADEYCMGKEKFQVFHKENGGLMSAWGEGVRKAKGQYIGFVDSDDFIATNMLELMSEAAVKYDADIVLCNHYYDSTSVGGKLVEHRNPINAGFYKGKTLDEIRRMMLPCLGRDYLSPARWNKLLKKSLLQATEKYRDERISSAEDVNSMVPCLLRCNSLYYIDVPLYYYEYRGNSISNVYNEELLDTYMILIEKLEQALKDCSIQMEQSLEQLINFYGVLWCLYVKKSKLSMLEKKRSISRLFEYEQFFEGATYINNNQGITARNYKVMMKYKNPSMFLWSEKVGDILKSLFLKGRK